MKTVQSLVALLLILSFAAPAAQAGEISGEFDFGVFLSEIIQWIRATIHLDDPVTVTNEAGGYVIPTG